MLSAPIWMSAEVNPAVLGHVVPTRSEAIPANALLEGQGILTVLKDVHQLSLRVSFYIYHRKNYSNMVLHTYLCIVHL